MKKHLIVGAILTGAWAATLFLIPNGAAADLQMPGGTLRTTLVASQPGSQTNVNVTDKTPSATGQVSTSKTIDGLPVKTQSVDGDKITVTVHSTDPSLDGKTITTPIDTDHIYPGNQNTAESLVDSVNGVIMGTLGNMVQGKSNVISALTIGLPQTIFNELGNPASSKDLLGDFSRGLVSVIQQFNTQFPLGIISDGITAIGGVVSGVAGAISNAGVKIDLTGLQSKNQDPVPQNSTQLPIIRISGDDFVMDKSNPSPMAFSYTDPKNKDNVNAYAQVNWSGSSTQLLPKKSYKIKLSTDPNGDDPLKLKFFEGGKKDDTYQLKANETDPTMARNIVNADVWKSMIATEPDLPSDLQKAPNLGSVQGFPVLVFVNGQAKGVYTLTTDKSAKLWGMDKKDDQDVAIQGNVNNAAAEMFDRPNAKVDDSDFSSETSDPISQTALSNLNSFIQFVDSTTNQQFKDQLSHYANVNSLIDYYLFVNVFGAFDQIAKNATYLSYDEGKTWRMQAYDNDLTLGNFIFGFGINDPYEMYYDASRGGIFPAHNRLLRRVSEVFGPEIAARYTQLRQDNIISGQTIYNKYVNFMAGVGYDNYTYDQSINPLTVNQYTQGLPALSKVIYKRISILDNHFDYKGAN